jgi:hypothetical protein
MTFDLKVILESKRALRRDLASLPIVEKLRILESMRQRELAIRRSKASLESVVKVARVHE